MYKQIQEWKLKHGRIFCVFLEGQDVIYRQLNCKEITDFANIGEDAPKVLPDLVILNNVKLKLAGSRLFLTSHVLEISIIHDSNDLEGKILLSKSRVNDNFLTMLIARICSVYKYTPDDLMAKSVEQVIDLAHMAELSVGKPFIFKQEKELNLRQPTERDSSKFKEPPVSELMEESVNALDAAMRKAGKKIPTLSEVKKKANPNLTDLQRQMKDLEAFTK